MAKISVYFNNSSSRAQSNLWGKRLRAHFFRHDINFFSPINLEDLSFRLREDVRKQTDYIFSVGGDGTANKIVQEIIGTEIKLLIIPAGTANDLARQLEISGSLKNIINVFNQKNILTLDAIKVNGQYMLTCGGLGLTSYVAEKINFYRKTIPGFKSLMKLTGDLIYPLFVAREYIAPLKHYKIHVDSKDFPRLDPIVKTCFVMINNQSKVGGNFTVAPKTKNDDGKFNVTIFCHQQKIDLLKTTYKIMRGEDVSGDKELISFETSHVELMSLSGNKIPFFGDGEILCVSQNFKIECIPQAVNVCRYNEKAILNKVINTQEVGLE